jgi:signal transduction histidine kinase
LRPPRPFAQFGQETHSWPIILLFTAAIVPSLCLVWLMNNAIANERLAARERLAQAYRAQLTLAQEAFEKQSTEAVRQIAALTTGPPREAFARCVQSGLLDSIVFFDPTGRVAYPDAPKKFPVPARERAEQWSEANELEFLRKDFVRAAERYEALANSTNSYLAARALQAQVRCFLRASQKDAALAVIIKKLRCPNYADALDPDGRFIVPNAELLALELIADPGSPIFLDIQQNLRARLTDYANFGLAAPQRRFLMNALRELAPGIVLPNERAEDLAAAFAPIATTPLATNGISPSGLSDVWQLTISNQAVALFTTERLAASIHQSDAKLALLPPGHADENALITIAAGAHFPGWHVSLSLPDANPIEGTTTQRMTLYLWTGMFALAVMVLLAFLAVRLARRQIALARLKTDLTTLVSHELKTPLASMRVFVDTLLQGDTPHATRTQEYLQLIAAENQRLTRLVEHFLCFSRLERKRWHFAPLPPGEIAERAARAVRPRFLGSNCHFAIELDPDLPLIQADDEALSTALINILDNAYKFSGDQKQIVLRAQGQNGHVIFAVEDNGIGIAPKDLKKIFRPFHQVDQRLSRSGTGVGLGLSIVQQIVSAHRGRTTVQSRLGAGSCFNIIIPAFRENGRN